MAKNISGGAVAFGDNSQMRDSVSPSGIVSGVLKMNGSNALPATAATNGKVAAEIPSSKDSGKSSDSGLGVAQQRYNVPDGLTKTQRKNFKKSIREKEKKALGGSRGYLGFPEDPLQQERETVLFNATRVLDTLPSLAEMKAVDVKMAYNEQQATLDGLASSLLDAQETLYSKIKKPDNRRMTSVQLLERIRELNSLPEKDDITLEHLEEQLLISVSWDNARKFQTQLSDIKRRLEERQRLNSKCIEGAREWERMLRLLDRVKMLKQSQGDSSFNPDQFSVGKLKSIEIELSPEAIGVLLPPVNIMRRVERFFAVAVDRATDRSRQRTFIISGLSDDVSNAVHFLTKSDFTGNAKVSLDARLMPGIIGKGGSGIRQLEEKYKCVFQAKESNDIVLYGLKDNIESASAHLKQLKSDKKIPESQITAEVKLQHPALARALTQKFQKLLRDIEAKHSVILRVSFGTSIPTSGFGSDVTHVDYTPSVQQRKVADYPGHTNKTVTTSPAGTGPSIMIRGRTKQSVDAACNDLKLIAATYRTVDIPAPTPDSLTRLFSRSNGGIIGGRPRSTGDNRYNSQSASDKFRLLVDISDNVAFLKNEGALALVGPMDCIEKVIGQATELLETASYTPVRVPIPTQSLFCFSPEKLSLIESTTGASLCRCRASDQVTQLEILGSVAQKQEAQGLIQEILEKEALTVDVPIVEMDTFTELSIDSRQKLRQIEELNGTRIIMDRNQMICTVIGSASNISLTRDALLELDHSHKSYNASLITRNIPILSTDTIKYIIGQKGATIQGIRETSKIHQILFKENENIICLRGTIESCDIAEKMIQDILGKSRHSGVAQSTVSVKQHAGRQMTPTSLPNVVVASKLIEHPHGLTSSWGQSVIPDCTPVDSVQSNTGNSSQSVIPSQHYWEGDNNHELPEYNQKPRTWTSSGNGIMTANIQQHHNEESDNKEAFPTLNEAIHCGRQQKHPNRRRKNGNNNNQSIGNPASSSLLSSNVDHVLNTIVTTSDVQLLSYIVNNDEDGQFSHSDKSKEQQFTPSLIKENYPMGLSETTDPLSLDINTESSDWYVQTTHDILGPLSISALRNAFQADIIDGMNFCWKDGMVDWRRISDTDELKPHMIQMTNDDDAIDNHTQMDHLLTLSPISDSTKTNMNTEKRVSLTDVPSTYKYITPEGTGHVYDSITNSWMSFIDYQKLCADPHQDVPVSNLNAVEPVVLESQPTESTSSLDENHKRLKNIENRKKYRERMKEKKKTGLWLKPKSNPNVYITGLPPDVLEDELDKVFRRAGVIKIDPNTSRPKIRIYKKSDGQGNGDATISFAHVESVHLAVKYLNGYAFRSDYIIHVEQAQFNTSQLKGAVSIMHPKERELQKKKYLAAKLEQQRLLGWNEGLSDGRVRIMILRPLWSYQEAQHYPIGSPFYTTIASSVFESLSEWVQVMSVTSIDRHPKGIVCVKFRHITECESAVTRLNNRSFRYLNLPDRELQLLHQRFEEWDKQHMMNDSPATYMSASLDSLDPFQLDLLRRLDGAIHCMDSPTRSLKCQKGTPDPTGCPLLTIDCHKRLQEMIPIHTVNKRLRYDVPKDQQELSCPFSNSFDLNYTRAQRRERLTEFIANHMLLIDAYIYDGKTDLKEQALPEQSLDGDPPLSSNDPSPNSSSLQSIEESTDIQSQTIDTQKQTNEHTSWNEWLEQSDDSDNDDDEYIIYVEK